MSIIITRKAVHFILECLQFKTENISFNTLAKFFGRSFYFWVCEDNENKYWNPKIKCLRVELQCSNNQKSKKMFPVYIF